MTIDFVTAYPKEITNAAWQKQKSFKDKTKKATKTGLGAELVKAEAAWKAIQFIQLDAKNFKPKDSIEAKRNQENAKFVVNLKVKPAIEALKEARVKALATAQNEALSPKARLAAGAIAQGLELRRIVLSTLNINDFKVAITAREAANVGGRALQKVTLMTRTATVGVGKKGIRQKDGSVVVYEIRWDEAVADPKTLLNTTLTVRSAYEDNATYQNDMKFIKLTPTGKTATLK